MVVQLCGSYSAAELSPPGPALADLRQAQAAGVSLSLYMEESVQELLRDAAERFKGWTNVPGPQHTELACRKVSATLFHFVVVCKRALGLSHKVALSTILGLCLVLEGDVS